MPKSSSSRPVWLIALLVAVVVLLVAAFTPRLPGDPAAARAVQSLGISATPAAWVTSLATRPALYVLMATGLLLATWRGRLRGMVATALLMLVWWYAGEPLKNAVRRPRPTSELVEVVRPSTGYSFPSTFATTWFSAWLPVGVYAWRTRQRTAGLALAIVAGLAIVVGAWARVRMGAHWPSDLLMTLALVWSTFSLLELAVARLDGPP